jgi:hypothetical protein
MVANPAPELAIARVVSVLGLSERDLATVLDADTRTLSRWRKGTHYPQHDARRRLGALLALADRLTESFTTADAARDWLRTPSRYLGGLTPLEALRAGRLDRVNLALEALDSGIFI